MTQTKTHTDLSAAIALLNAISAHFQSAAPSASVLRFQQGIVEVSAGLVRAQNRLAYLQDENDRLLYLLAGAYEQGLEIGGSGNHTLVAAIRELLVEVAR